MTNLQRLMFASCVLLLFAYEYQPVLKAGFVYQDYRWNDGCVERPLRSTDVWEPSAWPRSLMRGSWCWQYANTPNPVSFHVVNVGLHLIVSVLLGWLIWRLCAVELAAWMGASLFLVHRLNIEAVAYVSGRSELFAAMGILAACLAVLSESWLLAALAVIGGILGKESAVIALALMPLVLMARGLWRGAVALSVVLVLGLVLLMTAEGWPAPSFAWMLTQSFGAMRLVAMLLLPIGQTVDFDYALVPHLFQGIGLGLLCCAGVWAWRSARVPSLLSISLGWLVISTLPRLLVVTPTMALSEHQFYTPAMSLPLAVAHVIYAHTNAR